jgi:hypothetical protein
MTEQMVETICVTVLLVFLCVLGMFSVVERPRDKK